MSNLIETAKEKAAFADELGYRDHANTIRDLTDEIERLTACLQVANANHERFERLWYLEKDKVEALTAPQLHQHGGGVKPYGYVVEMRQDGYPPILWKRSRVQSSLMDAERTAAEWQSMIDRLSFLSKRTTRIIPLFAALAHQPLSVPSPLPTPSVLHEWNLKTGRCTECNCHYVGFERKDPCPGPAPAHPTQSDVSCSRAREGGTE